MASIDNLFDIIDSNKTPLLNIDEINVNLSKYSNCFSILHTNIRTLSKHSPDLEYLCSSLNNKCHMIITTEAWIDKNFNNKYFPLYKKL